MQDQNTKLSRREVFLALEGWKHLVQIERHPSIYQGTITALSPNTGTITFSAKMEGEQNPLVFHWRDADFERSDDPGDQWDEAFVVFPRSGESITLRKWK
ncbi:MAG: hypothetical protein ABI811_17680 [Acidobacteriota bacterium]